MRVRIEGDWVEVPFEVQLEHAGGRLDSFLAARLHRYSRAEVQRLIDDGKVLRPGRSVKASARVVKGETVIIRYEKRDEPLARYDRLPVLFEDASLVVVNKPCDVISHPTDRVVRNSVTSILRGQYGASLHLAHRLDRETSGALVLARTPEAARSLMTQFLGRTVKKEYLAVAAGRVAFERKTVDLPLGFEGAEIKVKQAVGAEGASPAVTDFERLGAAERASVVRAVPRTGRLHQIRVHLASLGHPVLGDKLYIGEGEAYMKAVRRELTPADLEALGAPRQMLHAWRIRLNHPLTGAPLEIEAPIPQDFSDCLARLGLENVTFPGYPQEAWTASGGAGSR
ncbi:MAG: RluA family pseudouridine synthase [Elusimicrobia bacterium]|nr:RluA family pseudouridine synthase [Elusimicrobiota bacterium]